MSTGVHSQPCHSLLSSLFSVISLEPPSQIFWSRIWALVPCTFQNVWVIQSITSCRAFVLSLELSFLCRWMSFWSLSDYVNIWYFNLHLVFRSLMKITQNTHLMKNAPCLLDLFVIWNLEFGDNLSFYLLTNHDDLSIIHSVKICILDQERCRHTHTHIHCSHVHTVHTYCSHADIVYTHIHVIHTHTHAFTYISKQVGVTSIFYIPSVEFSQVIVGMFLWKVRDRSRMVSN